MRGAAFLAAWALAFAGPARSGPPEFPIRISDGPLVAGLRALERQTGIELLYVKEAIRDLRSPPVVGTLTTEAALQQLLTETELTVRRAASGAWIIEPRDSEPLARQDAPVAEILVVGHRTQNADIRRFEEDVQPYTVATQAEIIRAHRDSLDQFLASRVTSNTTILPSASSQNAGVMSSFDLRGLGEVNTVVLIDGRRMPSLPVNYTGFRQSDLNALPLHAIERIEVLTGTAGGIHGFGALGGVVNVVLDRDTDGVEFHATQGLSSRGDSRRQGLEAKFGHSFLDGSTDLVIYAAHQESETPRAGDRSYAVRDRRRTHELAPDYYSLLFSHGDSLAVRSSFAIDPQTGEFVVDPELTFKPEFGGGRAGSNFTYLPVGFSGDNAALAQALQQYAGQIDFSLAANEARNDLGSNPRSSAVLANLRHRFASDWEAFADVILLRNQGESIGPVEVGPGGGASSISHGSGMAYIATESPANPFNEPVYVDYPLLAIDGSVRRRLENSRYTAGLVAPLPFDWRGTVEASWGKMQAHAFMHSELSLTGSFLSLFGDPSDLDRNPLGDWAAFDEAMSQDILLSTYREDLHTRFHSQALRLAGPLVAAHAERATLTLLLERRSETVPGNRETMYSELGGAGTTTMLVSSRSEVTQALYGELRAKPFDEASARVLRELEIQLALRRDDQENHFYSDPRFTTPEAFRARFTATAYTIGAKASPASWLMLRSSYATGAQPPLFTRLIDLGTLTFNGSLIGDPRRDGAMLNDGGDITVNVGGNPDLELTRATSMFIGVVVSPAGFDGPRIALDYSRIRRTRDPRAANLEQILAHEDLWPDRVRRAPLTPEDRANGFTGGLIQSIDLRDTNLGALAVDAFDLRAEWPVTLLGGRLRLYADATYHKRNERKTRFEPGVEWAGYLEGPLKRRANGGFDWSKGGLTFGANAQYYGSSLIFDRDFPGLSDEEDARIQGATRIPSQTYLDLYASWNLPAGRMKLLESATLDLGIVNALDRAPPRVTWFVSPGPGYSRYGDPRQRRFDLAVSCRF